MASIKIVLRKKANKQGLFPIALRITKDRKSSFILLGHYINESEWDYINTKVKKSHPNSVRLNNFIAQKFAEANDKIINLETSNKITNSSVIKNQIKRVSNKLTIFNVAKMYLDTLEKTKKFTRISADKPRINRLKEFFKTEQVYFEDLTESVIQKFAIYLRTTRNISERTVVNHIVLIRSLYSLAIKEEIVESKFYPFGKGKISIKFPESNKIGLIEEEVIKIEKLPNDIKNPQYHAKNVWLFAFYFAGMRISDVLQIKWNQIIDNRMYYTMGKNKKVLSLTIPTKAMKILQEYENIKLSNEDFIFPDLIGVNKDNQKSIRTRINSCNKRINKHLKNLFSELGIEKKISMHIARHTFGNLSGDKIPIQMLQKLYRHSSITTTINYQGNFIHKEADDALNSVIDF